MNVKQGDPLPIELQIENNDGSKFPSVVLRDENNTVLATLNLIHVQDGLYDSPSVYSMGSQEYITAQYLIYDDASRTIVSQDVGSSHDIFIQEEFSSGGGSVQTDQEITAIIKQSILTAQIASKNALIGTLGKASLKATIKPQGKVSGFVQGLSITATIKQNKITGTVEC